MPDYSQYAPQSVANTQPTDDESRALVVSTVNELRRMRFFRRQYDPRRAYWYRQYLGQRDTRYYPDNLTPRSNIFVPYPRNNVETVVSRTQDAFFSIDPYLEVRGKGPMDEASAPNMELWMLSALHRANFQKQFEILVRNICIYGHAAWKVDWDWDVDVITAPDPIYLMQPVPDPVTGQPILGPDGQPTLMPIINPNTQQPLQVGTQVMTKEVPRNRPKFIPIDVFDLLLDPDGRQIAHMMEKSFGQLKREVTARPDLYIPGALEELEKRITDSNEKDPDGVLIRLAEYWNETNNTVTLITFAEDNDAVSWKDLRYSYRNANYSSYKRKVFAGPPILLQHSPNPFIHKRAPILHTSYTMLTGEPYGVGVIEAISDLSEAMNKFSNMIMDNWNMGINKRYAYDSNADIDHAALSQFNVPGGKVAVNGNPNDVIFPLPTMAPTQAEFTILEVVKNMIELSSGISDFYNKGVGSSGGNRTATGIGQVITESNFLFKMFIRNVERDILQPSLEICASNMQQFCSDYVEYQVTQAPPSIPKVGRIPVEELIGNFHFDFVGANYATNKVMRQRNFMAALNIVLKTPYANVGEILREMYKILEIPNAARMVKPDQQVQMEQAQQMQQQAQMVLLEKILDTESKAIVAEVGKAEPNSVTGHGKEMQGIMEEMLAAAGELGFSGGGQPAGPKDRGGRPATSQHEGAIPGSGPMGATRSLAQGMGSNALGIGGMSEMGNS